MEVGRKGLGVRAEAEQVAPEYISGLAYGRGGQRTKKGQRRHRAGLGR
jgi:hypothetical protein